MTNNDRTWIFAAITLSMLVNQPQAYILKTVIFALMIICLFLALNEGKDKCE